MHFYLNCSSFLTNNGLFYSENNINRLISYSKATKLENRALNKGAFAGALKRMPSFTYTKQRYVSI